MQFSQIKGIVFDLDGTLIHSKIDFPKMKQRMIGVLERNDVPQGILSSKETNVIIFEKAEKAWDKKRKPESDRKRIREQLEDAMNCGELEALRTVKEIKGVTKSLFELKSMGYKLAVLTRSHHAYALKALEKIKALKYFDEILGRNETPKPKPYAEALLYSAKKLGLWLDEVLFVGDNHLDHLCAMNAKTKFIGVRTGPRGDDSWEKNIPEIIIESVKDLPYYLRKKDL